MMSSRRDTSVRTADPTQPPHAGLHTSRRKHWIVELTLYNESGVNAGLDFTGSFKIGPADPSHAWDDSIDDTD